MKTALLDNLAYTIYSELVGTNRHEGGHHINTLKYHDTTLQRAKKLLYSEEITHIESKPLNEVCEILGISQSTLRNLFHKHHGMSPRNYIIEMKMAKVAELLHLGHMSITDISIYVGYENFSKMSTRFKAIYGMTPSEFKQSIKI